MTTKDYPNYYENLKEAEMRLKGTVVLYDGEPFNVVCLANHKDDGIFRVYMEPIGLPIGSIFHRFSDIPYEYPEEQRGGLMDAWMEKNKDSGVVRKMMNSPLFNKFRPFELGMCNTGTSTLYLERQPTRATSQGMSESMLSQYVISLGKNTKHSRMRLYSAQMRSCILGEYPSFSDCLKNLLDKDVENDAAAFHRQFALVRGPLNTLFLAYKSDVVAFLPNSDTSCVQISSDFRHTKEVINDLQVFQNITIK